MLCFLCDELQDCFDIALDKPMPMPMRGFFIVIYQCEPFYHSFAVKAIAKRWAPGQYMEPLFVQRIQHEVDIYNHIGRQASSTWQRCCMTGQPWDPIARERRLRHTCPGHCFVIMDDLLLQLQAGLLWGLV